MPEKQKKNSISINKYKTKRELNIGTLIFALIFIYLVVAVVVVDHQRGNSGKCGK